MNKVKDLLIYTQEYDKPIRCRFDSSQMTAKQCLNGYLTACLEGHEDSDLTFYNSKEVSTLDRLGMIEVSENIFTDSIINWEVI